MRNAVLVVWAGLLVALLRHREVISTDTLSNYVHVWYVAERISDGHGIPYHMPVLASGDGLAFPYAFIPWMVAALLWPVLGEWAVTFCLGAGFLGLVAATFWAFPELRRGWWAVAALVNPALVEGLMLGQLPFLWASAFFVAAIGCWRTERYRSAVVLAALAQVTHVAILGPLVALAVLARMRYEPDRGRLIKAWLISTIPAVPAGWIVLMSPFAEDQSFILTLWIEIETLALRSLVVVVPIGLVLIQRRANTARAAAGVAAILVAGQIVFLPISSMSVGWGALTREPDPAAAEMTKAPEFVAGATYRVLSKADGKYSQYAVVRAGGILDSEFFPESMHRRGFRDAEAYAEFLTDREVDYVIVQGRYRQFRTNEDELLQDFAECQHGLRITQIAERAHGVTIYAVDRDC